MADKCISKKKNTAIRVSCAVIVSNDGLVFAARRGPEGINALTWEFPGGKVEEGETDEQCLHRELSEELGIQVAILSRMPQVWHAYPDFEIALIPFICAMAGGILCQKEHHETGWFTLAELTKLSWSAADRLVVESLTTSFRHATSRQA
jgi:8-oxo-dGTP diphosphatase